MEYLTWINVRNQQEKNVFYNFLRVSNFIISTTNKNVSTAPATSSTTAF